MKRPHFRGLSLFEAISTGALEGKRLLVDFIKINNSRKLNLIFHDLEIFTTDLSKKQRNFPNPFEIASDSPCPRFDIASKIISVLSHGYHYSRRCARYNPLLRSTSTYYVLLLVVAS